MVIRVSSRQIFRTHLFVITCLVLAPLLMHVVFLLTGHDYIFGIRPLFDLNKEKNVPALFSASAILISALTLFVLHRRYRLADREGATFFLIIGCVFLYLACDEAFSFHELLTPITNQQMNVGGAFFKFSWIAPALLFSLVVFLFSLKFLWRTDPDMRKFLVLSGAVFITGAVGLEAAMGFYIESVTGPWTLWQNTVAFILSACEETMEMLGIALFLYGLLRHFERHFGALTLRAPPSG